MARLPIRKLLTRDIPPTPFEPVAELTEIIDVEKPTEENLPAKAMTSMPVVEQVDDFELPHQKLDHQLKKGDWNEIVDGIINGEYVVYPKSQIETVFTEHEILASFLIEMIDKVAAVKDMLGEENLKFITNKSKQLEGKGFIEIMSDITLNGSKYWEVISQIKAISSKIGQTFKFNFGEDDLIAVKGLLLRNEVSQDKFENLMKLPN